MATNRLVIQEQIATYGRLLFEAANNDGGADSVLETCVQGKQVAAAIRGNYELQTALKDPGYSAEQKVKLVRGVFSAINLALLNALTVMAERGEVKYLDRVIDQVEDAMATQLDLIIVDVETAIELDDNLRELVKKKAEKEMGKRVILNERVNKAILGGIIMSTRGERIDASLLVQVEKIREALAG